MYRIAGKFDRELSLAKSWWPGLNCQVKNHHPVGTHATSYDVYSNHTIIQWNPAVLKCGHLVLKDF